jgi:hypothetical protein
MFRCARQSGLAHRHLESDPMMQCQNNRTTALKDQSSSASIVKEIANHPHALKHSSLPVFSEYYPITVVLVRSVSGLKRELV